MKQITEVNLNNYTSEVSSKRVKIILLTLSVWMMPKMYSAQWEFGWPTITPSYLEDKIEIKVN